MLKRFSNYENEVEVSSLMFYDVDLPSRHLGVIEEVQTLPDFRRQGRATKLIQEAIAHAKSVGCTCVELTVRQDNKEVQDFYKSLGFEDRLNLAYRYKL